MFYHTLIWYFSRHQEDGQPQLALDQVHLTLSHSAWLAESMESGMLLA
jgi:hypothetical protein